MTPMTRQLISGAFSGIFNEQNQMNKTTTNEDPLNCFKNTTKKQNKTPTYKKVQ